MKLFKTYENTNQENLRDQCTFICNFPKDQILSIERDYWGKVGEASVIGLKDPNNILPESWYFYCSRKEHNRLVAKYISDITKKA